MFEAKLQILKYSLIGTNSTSLPYIVSSKWTRGMNILLSSNLCTIEFQDSYIQSQIENNCALFKNVDIAYIDVMYMYRREMLHIDTLTKIMTHIKYTYQNTTI